MTQTKKLILGGPGCGKTTRLLQLVEHAIKNGTAPDRIAFVAFSKAASGEALERARDIFDFHSSDLPWFRTLHSLAFRQLNMRRNKMIGHEHLKELEELTGERLTGRPQPGEQAAHPLFLEGYARARLIGINEAWRDTGALLEPFKVQRCLEIYAAYKLKHRLLDFSDLLYDYANSGPPVDVDLAIVDEAQDLTTLQRLVISTAFRDTNQIIFAGDDDQCIHKWAGATPDAMFEFTDPEVLPKSHRLPKQIHQLANGIINRVSKRWDKPFEAEDREGVLQWHGDTHAVDLSSNKWLLLARSEFQLQDWVAAARMQGVLYEWKGKHSVDPDHLRSIREYEQNRKKNTSMPIWHDQLQTIPLGDREYYLAVLRRGERLTGDPRIRITTVHASKGLEEDNVGLITDLPGRVASARDIDPDSERRVLYVALTRAREELHLIYPQTIFSWRDEL